MHSHHCGIAHRHSIFCILPPYILREIARNGTAAQRDAALDTLAIDGTFRTQRITQSLLPSAPRSVVMGAPVLINWIRSLVVPSPAQWIFAMTIFTLGLEAVFTSFLVGILDLPRESGRRG